MSKSSSSSSTSSNTNIDKRQVVDGGSIGITSDQSTVTVQAVDAEIVNKALDTVAASDATAGEGFVKLLDLAGNIFERSYSTIEATQGNLNQAYEAARGGSIDNRTIMILGIAGAAAVAFIASKR